MEENIYKIGYKLGIAKDEIKGMLKRRKRGIIIGGLFVFALAFMGHLFYLGVEYGGISLGDFEIFERFRFLRFLRFLFGF